MFKWEHLEENGIESKWITIRPKLLPRDIPILIVGEIYNPSKNDTAVNHIQSALEQIWQKHPKAGIILAGDLNQLKTMSIASGFHLKQIVDVPTQGKNNLDKITTYMRKYYCNPFTIGKLGSSDHEAVVAIPSIAKGWKPPEKKTISCQIAPYDQKYLVSDTLTNNEWSEMYSSQTNQKFEYFRLTSEN